MMSVPHLYDELTCDCEMMSVPHLCDELTCDCEMMNVPHLCECRCASSCLISDGIVCRRSCTGKVACRCE